LKPDPSPPTSDPFWYKSGVIYELHVRAFYDSDGDGVGDFRGLTQKLDYLQDLGVTALWLLPFYPSPLKDDGYDIADYCDIHPRYGTLADFRAFLQEAHARRLRVITELVLNHTSDQHPWFQRARRAPSGSRWRNFYVWSDTPDRYRDARIIFKDVEVSNWTWDHAAQAYYWHRFFSHQPDLNYDNPEVFAEMIKVLDFWLDLGVDGLRLDAVPYLFEREDTSCENLPQTHEALKQLRRHVDEKYRGRMLLAEANQWPEDAVAYFGQGRGDECHMAYHFPLMPRLFMALRMEDRTPIVDILEQTPPIPETCQWALFLRNHDELTLEMVTDEERDYMYRAYAHVHQARLNLGIRRRLAPLLGNDRKRIELLHGLLLSLPGTPVLYYGDEIGMGDNIFLGDRNGVRTPMQWSSDKNAGFSRANPQSLYLPIIYDPEYHYEAVNVESQSRNPHSLLWWLRRLLALRKRWRALGEGQCEFLQPENRKVLCYLLRHGDETLLVVANLSRFVQPVELDLAAFAGCAPVELFGRTRLPPITDKPYFLTLNSHSFVWCSLERSKPPPVASGASPARRTLTVPVHWTEVLHNHSLPQLEQALAEWLPAQPWFGARSRSVNAVAIRDAASLNVGGETCLLLLLQVETEPGEADWYALPVAFARPDADTSEHSSLPATGALHAPPAAPAILCEVTLETTGQRGVLYDAVGSRDCCKALLDFAGNQGRAPANHGELAGKFFAPFRRVLGESGLPEPAAAHRRGNNSSILFGDKFVLKLFHRVEAGPNPDVEISRFLTEHGFPHAPPLAGTLEFRPAAAPEGGGLLPSEPLTLGMVTGYVAHSCDAWTYTLDALGRYYDRVGALMSGGAHTANHGSRIPDLSPADLMRDMPRDVVEVVGTYLDSARLLGERTAGLHRCLATDADDPAFAPELVTPHYARGLFQTMRNQAKQNLGLLRQRLTSLPPDTARLAERVLAQEAALIARFRLLHERRIGGRRIRCHGDFHLGQVLYTGKDFVIIDFEGEPALPLSERRIKRSPLRDVAGLVRSFHYAAWAGLYEHEQRGSLETERRHQFEPWLRLWFRAVSSVYLRSYFKAMETSALLPCDESDLARMLPAYLLHKAVYEIGHELLQRPAWLHIPLRGILETLETAAP
jgi:maltose alpha-D-glucosyltransferase/alpha-amylase